MIQKFLQFNDLSEEAKNSVPKLIGEKTLHMLTGVKNNHPLPEEQAKRPVIYPLMAIPPRDLIWDRGHKKYVEIAYGDVLNTDDGKQVMRLNHIIPGMGMASWSFSGKFTLREGVAVDEKLWSYLHLSDYIKKEGRNESKPLLVEVCDFDKEELSAANDIDEMTEALNNLKLMSDDEVEEISAAMNWQYEPKKDVLRARVKKLAAKDPKQFMKIASDPDTKLKATLKKALDIEVIKYRVDSGVIEMGGASIVSFGSDNAPGFDYLSTFATWIKSAKNGGDVLSSIQKQIGAWKPEKAKNKK